MKHLRAQDLGQVIDFDSRVLISQSFTSNVPDLEDAIRKTTAGGSTSLHNAIYISLKELKKIQARNADEVQRQAIVVLSDGEDTSSLVSFDEVLELAKRSETAIYAIGLRGKGPEHLRGSFNEADYVLRELSQQTGGRVFFARSASELASIYEQISDELSSQYMIGYTSRNPKRDGAWRRVVVRVKEPNITARTKQGYYAPTGGRRQWMRMRTGYGPMDRSFATPTAYSTGLPLDLPMIRSVPRSIVYLIGAGPGDPGLITRARTGLPGHRRRGALRPSRPPAPAGARAEHAERIDVGTAAPQAMAQEAICYLLAEKAREGRIVARLKWGDPFVFDRGGEEALFLHEQGVPFEVVPGIPAAIGIPSYAGVPITYPGGGDTVTLVRGHEDESQTAPQVDWASLAKLKGTIVCYAGTQTTAGDPRRAALAWARPGAIRRRSSTRARCRDSRRSTARSASWPSCTKADAAHPSGDPRRRTRRRAAPAPALVRRSSALRQAHRRDAAEGRCRRICRIGSRGAWCRRRRGADDPHRAARGLGAARSRGAGRRQLRVDRLHQRERRRSVHAAAVSRR